MKAVSLRVQVTVGAVAALVMTGLSVMTVAASRGGDGPASFGFPSSSTCAAPSLTGTVVRVALTNMGGPMMGQGGGMMRGGAMRLSADHATVAVGSVSFVATNGGSIEHELVILPLAGTQKAGTRPIGGDGKVDESESVGEASANCGEGTGNGIAPGGSSWVTLNLAPGRYELVCNLPGHYGAGMYTQLTVT